MGPKSHFLTRLVLVSLGFLCFFFFSFLLSFLLLLNISSLSQILNINLASGVPEVGPDIFLRVRPTGGIMQVSNLFIVHSNSTRSSAVSTQKIKDRLYGQQSLTKEVHLGVAESFLATVLRRRPAPRVTRNGGTRGLAGR